MWSACTVKNHGRTIRCGLRLVLPFGLGFLLGCVMLGLVLTASDGTEPRGVCMFVAGDSGFLPLDANSGGTNVYSCNLNVRLAVLYVALPGIVFTVLLLYLSEVLSYVGALARCLVIGDNQDTSTSAIDESPRPPRS